MLIIKNKTGGLTFYDFKIYSNPPNQNSTVLAERPIEEKKVKK